MSQLVWDYTVLYICKHRTSEIHQAVLIAKRVVNCVTETCGWLIKPMVQMPAYSVGQSDVVIYLSSDIFIIIIEIMAFVHKLLCTICC